MTPHPLYGLAERSRAAGVDVVESGCSEGHRSYLLGIGTVGDVDQTAVIVLTIEATEHVLVGPLKICRAYE